FISRIGMVLWSAEGGGNASWLRGNADVKSRKSAGLSKESAGKASNLMRRPVRQGNRDATTSACVGWDERNIENQPTFRKMASARAGIGNVA
ncbi:MAG: hypothetical protein WBE02_14705, partial [Bradyrhizobium sp.]